MLKKLLLFLLLLAAPAFAQNVQQGGSVTRNHIPVWLSSGVLGDAGSSANGPISSIGITNNGANGLCINSASITAASGYNQLCLGTQTAGPALVSLQNFGAAAAQSMQFIINGTTLFTAYSIGGHVTWPGGTTPTLTAGCNGAGSSVSGSDVSGTVIGQTAVATTCTLNFGTAFTSKPNCVASGQSSPLTGAFTPSTTSLVVNFASTANYVWSYICFGT